MAFGQADLEIAERHVAALSERVAEGQARLLERARRGEAGGAAEVEHHALVEALGRLIDHVAAIRLAVARGRRDRPAGPAPRPPRASPRPSVG